MHLCFFFSFRLARRLRSGSIPSRETPGFMSASLVRVLPVSAMSTYELGGWNGKSREVMNMLRWRHDRAHFDSGGNEGGNAAR